MTTKGLGKLLALSTAIALASATSGVRATVFFDDFESYTVGSDLHGQNGWKGWDNSPQAGAIVSEAHPWSGAQSVNVTGPSDLVHEFSGIGGGTWTFSIDQYVPATSTGVSYIILLNMYADGGPYNWSVQNPCDLGAGVVKSDYVGDRTLPMIKDAWINWTFEINLDANQVAEFYNGQFLCEHSWQVDGANALAAVDLYANGAGPVYYDNISVTPVPEPAALAFTIAMLGPCGLVLLLRRKSR